jgi:hypothetical protein
MHLRSRRLRVPEECLGLRFGLTNLGLLDAEAALASR